ncbi:hypothetical protein NF700_12840 [Sphingomonadaceae bacterium OTU29MARTA1]|nr:hypothetical protein NF700_12840 [Sphingomonadaceae bacterium OTU29MARTA1]
MLDLPWIRGLIEAMRDAPIAELEVERDGCRVAIRRSVAAREAPTPRPVDTFAPPIASARVEEPIHPVDADADTDHVVTTADYGVFHRAAAAGGVPFATEGQQVGVGQQLGVIEAMKVFSPIIAPIAGRVVEVFAVDGAEVEAGSRLFRLR